MSINLNRQRDVIKSPKKRKTLIIILLYITISGVGLALFSVLLGCNIGTPNSSSTLNSTTPYVSPTQPNSTPPPLIKAEASFPDGAPALNQTAKLICKVKTTLYTRAQDMSINIILPDGLELVSGQLSWTGSVPEATEITVINTTVRAVQVGNWTVTVDGYIDPEKHGGFDGNGHYDIYVSITENSAEWGFTRPWVPPFVPPSVTPVE